MRRYGRKPNRSRRIVKKLLRRAARESIATGYGTLSNPTNWNVDAYLVDGGKRWVTGQEVTENDLGRECPP